MELGFTDQRGWDVPDYDSTAFVGDRWRCAGQSCPCATPIAGRTLAMGKAMRALSSLTRPTAARRRPNYSLEREEGRDRDPRPGLASTRNSGGMAFCD
jgi:hypothetical protein